MRSTSPSAVQAEREWRRWRLDRERALAAPYGWLSLTALHWLTPIAREWADLPGRWWHDRAGIWVEPGDERGSEPLTVDGAPLGEPRLLLAEGRAGREVRTGERVVELLDRGPTARGVRIRDPRSATRTSFQGVPVFPYDPAWVVTGTFEPYRLGPKDMAVGSVAEGLDHIATLAGTIILRINGSEVHLAVSAGQHPVLSFRDGTSGVQTYGALRFVRVVIRGSEAVVDFNRAVNPPCAFTEFGTCPLPPPGNSMQVQITAGERTPR